MDLTTAERKERGAEGRAWLTPAASLIINFNGRLSWPSHENLQEAVKEAARCTRFQAGLPDNARVGKSCRCWGGWCYLRVRLDSLEWKEGRGGDKIPWINKQHIKGFLTHICAAKKSWLSVQETDRVQSYLWHMHLKHLHCIRVLSFWGDFFFMYCISSLQ